MDALVPFEPNEIFHAKDYFETSNFIANHKIDIAIFCFPENQQFGIDYIRKIKLSYSFLPIVAIAQEYNQPLDVECIKAGAQDFLTMAEVKKQLPRIIVHAVERQKEYNKVDLAEHIAKVAHWEWNQTEDQLNFSSHFYKLTGYDPVEFGTNVESFLEHVHKQDRNLVKLKIQEGIKHKRPFDVDCQILCKAGHYKHIYIVGKTLDETNIQNLSYFGVIQDITERKISENVLRQAKQDAEKNVKLREEMVSIVSHDIRGPIGTMKSLIEFANNSKDPYAAAREMNLLDRIHRQSGFVLTLTDQILNLASLRNKIDLNIENVDLRSVMYTAIESFSAKIREKQIKIDIERYNSEIYVDRLRFQQVINNVLGNAIKFSPDHGKIEITFSDINEGTIKKFPEALKISIKDQGPGVPKNLQRAIFNKFQRLKTAQETEGIGLGLAITIDIVKKHKGNIWVESDGKTGSTFHITIPLLNTKMNGEHDWKICYV